MKRRTFLKQFSGTGLATGSLLSGGLGAAGRQGSLQDLAEIGMVVAQGCHAQAVWADTMNPSPGRMRTTGMVITKVWSFRADFAAGFAERFPGVEVVGNLEDLVGTVDGVYIDAMPAVSLYHLLARPFLLAGMPTFVNRPFSTSIEKARLIVEAAGQGKAPLMSNSTWEFAESVGDLQDKASRMPRILGYAAHNSMSDYYTHGVHGVYYIAAVLREERKRGRGKCLQASYLTPDWRKPPGALSFVHEDGDGGSFYGQLHLQSDMDGQAYLRLFGDRSGDFEGKIPASPGWFRYNTWNAMQLVIQEMILKRTPPEQGDDLLEKAAMFLMGFKSALEGGGAPVSRKDVEGWEIPPPSLSLKKEGFPSDSVFAQPYTAEELKSLERYLS